MGPHRIWQGIEINYIGDEFTNQYCIKSKTGANQFYDDIIAKHNAKNPFEDPEFPRTKESIGQVSFDVAKGSGDQTPNWDRTFHWKRVRDLVDPKLKVIFFPNDGEQPKYSRFDINQGGIGDCWFIAGLAEITHHPKLMEFIVPSDNLHNNDSGAYHFRMYHHGICVDVVVDDWIPCGEFDGPGKGFYPIGLKPVELKSEGVAKIWMVMAEKAYAKLNRSYAEIENNQPHNALEDLTGGIGYFEPLPLEKVCKPGYMDSLWEDLKENFSKGDNFIVWGSGPDKMPPQGYLGLRYSHAYTMTGITSFELEGETQKLVRLRNPWGHTEWQGNWSDNSPLWDQVPIAKRQELGLIKDNDVPVGLVAKLGERVKSIRRLDYVDGCWSIAKGTAGGSANPAKNRHYIVTVGAGTNRECDLMVALQIKCALKDLFKLKYGYQIFWVSDPTFTKWKRVDWFNLGPDFFEAPENRLVKSAGSAFGVDEGFTNSFGRDVVGRFKVKAGTYVVVPTTEEPNVEAEFVLRLWHDEDAGDGIVVAKESLEIDAVTGKVVHTKETL